MPNCHLSFQLLCDVFQPLLQADLEKMGMGLNKLAQEDPSFGYSRDEETGQTVIEGMGELHLEIIVDRLRREFKVCWVQGFRDMACSLGLYWDLSYD